MATDPHKNRKQTVEKATVLLTLAADSQAVRGPCLSNEEMAALVEGRSGKRDLAEIWTHLGSCRRCYEEWLFLKKYVRRDAPRGRLYHLRRLGKLRYIGTALAAAASIAVYLNVVKMADKEVEQGVVPQAEIMQDKNLVAPLQGLSAIKKEKNEAARTVEQTPTVLPAAPRTAPATLGSGTGSGIAKGRLEMRPEPRKSAEKPLEERQEPAAAPLQAARKAAKEVAGDAAPPPLAERAVAPAAAPPMEAIDGWLEELRTACLSGRQEAQFWGDMVARGGKLSAGTREEKMVAVLVLVQEINGSDTVPQQCQLILAELAKNSRSR